MVQKFRVVKYERSTSMGATTSEALLTTMTTPEKVSGTCKDGFTSKEEAENYKIAIWERNPYAYFKIEGYFI
jgi:hypothetical protein